MSRVSFEFGDTIYLDYHSTTPCDPRVVEVINSAAKAGFGNPSSPHAVGRKASSVVETARSQVAEHIGAFAGEIVFTSGATESNNLVLLGLAGGADRVDSGRSRIVTSAIEHKSVLKAADAAASRFGLTHTTVPVTEEGIVDVASAASIINEKTLLVSVQAVNNELGTVQPVMELAELAHEKGALFHCDAAQALGRLKFDVKEWGVDFLSLSSHKAYGPKGIGALYVAGSSRARPLAPLMFGGGQEDEIRPGTVNVPAVAGFAKACSILDSELESECVRIKGLRNRFEDEILTNIHCARATVPRDVRVASTSSIRLEGVEAEAVLARLHRVAVSTGSACESGAPEPSHVLQAMGFSRSEAYQCIRAAIGRFTTGTDVVQAAKEISHAVQGIETTVGV